MTRYKAFTLHLIASAVAMAIIFLLIQQVWYPGKLFTLAAGFSLLCLIVGVDLVIGPLITLIIFNPKKKYLKIDMAIVILFQVGFMAYGFWTMFSTRPVYYVFVDNRFYLVRANELDDKDIKLVKNEQFRHVPLWGPKFVGTQEPTDAKLRNEIAVSGLFGMGLQNLPQYYVPYDQVTKQVLASAKTSEQLPIDTDARNRLLHYEKNHHATQPVLFLTVVNKKAPLITMIDAKTAQVIALI